LAHHLQTARLTLSGAQAEDWREYFPILSDPETYRFSNLPRRPTERRVQRMVNWMVRVGESGKGFGWMVRERNSGRLAGCIRLNAINRSEQTATVGYEFGPAFRGLGYATEALRKIVEHCHGEMGLRRLEAWTVEGNAASDRVLQKTGFRQEGTLRQKITMQNERLDMKLFGRLEGD
jgi:[ribosomal protein S5]-alanine N-acetyltransferase